MKQKNLLLPCAAALGALGISFAASELMLRTTSFSLKTDTREEIRIAVLSDLHFSRFGKDNSRLTEAVRRIKPDLIFLVGDFFDVHSSRDNTELCLKTLSSLSAVADTYFAPGNHDLRYGVITGRDYKALARSCSVRVLDGEYEDVEMKGCRLRIGGVYDHASYLEDFGEEWKKSRAYAFLKEFDACERTKLLLMHRPNTFIYSSLKTDIDAVFCGHDHGGIWRLPFIGGIYAPEQGIFPKYDAGEYTFGKTRMYLCAGLEGYYAVPRLFNRPQLLSVTLAPRHT